MGAKEENKLLVDTKISWVNMKKTQEPSSFVQIVNVFHLRSRFKMSQDAVRLRSERTVKLPNWEQGGGHLMKIINNRTVRRLKTPRCTTDNILLYWAQHHILTALQQHLQQARPLCMQVPVSVNADAT